MIRGGKRAEVAAELSRARKRNQSAVRETDKNVGFFNPLRNARILAISLLQDGKSILQFSTATGRRT